MTSQEKDSNTCKYNRNQRFKKHSGYAARSHYATIINNNRFHKKKSSGRRQLMKVLTDSEINDIRYLSNKYVKNANNDWKKCCSNSAEEGRHQQEILDRSFKKKYPELYGYTRFNINLDGKEDFYIHFDKEDINNIKKLFKSCFPDDTKPFLQKEMILDNYNKIFSSYDLDCASLKHILRYYNYSNILCAQPGNGKLLSNLYWKGDEGIHRIRLGSSKKNAYILHKYYPIDNLELSVPLNIEAVNYYDSEPLCIWWEINREQPINWLKYRYYALLMTEYDENILRDFKGSFVILLDKKVTLNNYNILYRHKDFVIYQKGGECVSFYKNNTKKKQNYFNSAKNK